MAVAAVEVYLIDLRTGGSCSVWAPVIDFPLALLDSILPIAERKLSPRLDKTLRNIIKQVDCGPGGAVFANLLASESMEQLATAMGNFARLNKGPRKLYSYVFAAGLKFRFALHHCCSESKQRKQNQIVLRRSTYNKSSPSTVLLQEHHLDLKGQRDLAFGYDGLVHFSKSKNQSSSSRVTHWGTLLDAVGKGVVDAVREIHRNKSSFTRPHRGKDKWKKSLITASTLFDAPSSDHRPVTASLRLPQPPPPASSSLPSSSSFLRRLNSLTFADPRFDEMLAKVADLVLLSPVGPSMAWEFEKARLVSFSSQLSRDIHLERAAAREAHPSNETGRHQRSPFSSFLWRRLGSSEFERMFLLSTRRKVTRLSAHRLQLPSTSPSTTPINTSSPTSLEQEEARRLVASLKTTSSLPFAPRLRRPTLASRVG
ncbi:hypothetical protein BCR35DRAFT_327335 [Leucosporidium creatinivorum]|uniref:Uncharacterized protein n=1 Tax=Leucosporidium creatinivorum TaxID=106004 RepID=A0A1Y2CIG5_9BASI|nr:hypothetical protein BCR35DRAFT_327335 [Leucosporidium creatinivorum]